MQHMPIAGHHEIRSWTTAQASLAQHDPPRADHARRLRDITRWHRQAQESLARAQTELAALAMAPVTEDAPHG